ncbi:hypothetical protein QQ045_022362 [Rhodiola kirilowii]
MGFDVALESQRQIRSTCDHEARSKRSRISIPLLIELHALQTYTTTIFQDVQTEICASCFDVSIITVVESENGKVHEAVYGRYKKTFKVTEDSSTDSFLCTCKLFEWVGYQCSHVFAAIKYACIEKKSQRVEQCQVIQEAGMVDQDLWMDFNTCLSIADNDNVKREYIRCKLKEMRLHLEQLSIGHRVASKIDIISDLISASKPIERTVNSPALVHTKGSGKRLASNFDVAIKKSQRALHMCKPGIENAVEGVQSGVDNDVEGVQSGADNVVEGVQSGADNAVEGVKSGADNDVAGVQSGTENAVEGVQFGADNAVEGVQFGADTLKMLRIEWRSDAELTMLKMWS